MLLDEPVRIGIIAGVGQSRLFDEAEHLEVPTPYGSTSQHVRLGEIGGRRVAFVARRGEGEVIQPHLVPYRANVWALASLGVKALVTTTASGGLRDAFAPGTFVVPDQIVDRTAGRPHTFYDEGPAVQLAAPEPFDPTLRFLAAEALARQQVRYRDFGTAVVIGGPRFATAAESRWHAMMGADLVNMTLMPETALALELGMAVVNLSLITDRDADTRLDHGETTGLDLVRRRVAQAQGALAGALHGLVAAIPTGFTAPTAIPLERIQAVLAREVRTSARSSSRASAARGSVDDAGLTHVI